MYTQKRDPIIPSTQMSVRVTVLDRSALRFLEEKYGRFFAKYGHVPCHRCTASIRGGKEIVIVSHSDDPQIPPLHFCSVRCERGWGLAVIKKYLERKGRLPPLRLRWS